MADVFKSYGVGIDGKQIAIDIINGISFLAGTKTPTPEGMTVQTAGGIYKKENGIGVLVANHNMIPIAQKGITPIQSIEQKEQQNTIITPNPLPNIPVTAAPPVTPSTVTGGTANALPDIVYLADGTAQQNTVASLGIDNSTLVMLGVLGGGLLLLRKVMK